jgi:hypothetical protein
MRRAIVTFAFAALTGPVAAELIEVKLTSDAIVEKQLTIAPGKFVEVCSPLQRGQVVLWQFRADTAIDFNVHFHVGERVHYPEQRPNIHAAGGRLSVEVDQGYCWMWSSRSNAPVVVDAKLNLASPAR